MKGGLYSVYRGLKDTAIGFWTIFTQDFVLYPVAIVFAVFLPLILMEGKSRVDQRRAEKKRLAKEEWEANVMAVVKNMKG